MLAETDVLTWWGHMAHEEVAEEVVERVQRRVLDGMGLDRPAFGAFIARLPPPDGHERRPALARGRASASCSG